MFQSIRRHDEQYPVMYKSNESIILILVLGKTHPTRNICMGRGVRGQEEPLIIKYGWSSTQQIRPWYGYSKT